MPTQTIRGTVEQVNDKGVKIAGEWYNYSQFKTFDIPSVGDAVELKVGGKSGTWIYELKFLTRGGVSTENNHSEVNMDYQKYQKEKDLRMVKMSALKSAVEFLKEKKNGKKDLKPIDAITVAKEFEEYLLGNPVLDEEPGDEDVPF